MRVGCVICGDLFVPADEISATPCGHTFHSLCLIQWIERSKSCPQCRHKATEKSLLKLYFDSGVTESSQVDPDMLQNHIDNLKFQIRLKETEATKVKESNSTLSKQNKGLKEECKTLELRVRDKESTNLALKSQLKYMDQFKTEAETAREKAKNLKSQLAVLQNVEMIVSGTNQDVESMLTSYSHDPESMRSLATFCSILKKELNKTVDDKKRFREEASSLRMRVKELKHNCNSAGNQLDKTEQVNRLLQDDVLSLESENSSLKKKVEALQSAIASPSGDVKNSALHRLIAESPAPSELKRPHCSSSEDDVMLVTPEVVRKMARQEESSKDNSIEYLGITSTQDEVQQNFSPRKKNIILPGRRPLAVTTNISGRKPSHHNIFAKNVPSLTSVRIKPSLKNIDTSQPSSSSSQMGYDGLGGHHKVDEFPKSKTLFLKKKSGVKFVTKDGSNGRVQKTTLKNFFQNTFDDDL